MAHPQPAIPEAPAGPGFQDTVATRWKWLATATIAIALVASACGSSDGDSLPVTGQADDSTAATSTQTDESETDQTTQAEPDAGSEESANTVELVSGSVEVDGGLITTVRADGSYAKSTVLFLHGAAYTSQTWVQNEILAKVAEAGIDVIAIDLPSYGTSGRTGLESEEFLAGLFASLELDPATTTIVSPSMSGGFSLPALRQPFFADLAGYVPVAPVGSGAFVAAGPALDIPALVIWGDGDGGDPQSAAEALAASFTTSTVLILPDAGHAAYQQQPELFAQALIEFVQLHEAD